jgi:hypothetical protein
MLYERRGCYPAIGGTLRKLLLDKGLSSEKAYPVFRKANREGPLAAAGLGHGGEATAGKAEDVAGTNESG